MKKATLAVSGLFACSFAFAQGVQPAQTENAVTNVEVLYPSEMHVSIAVRDLPDYEETDKLYEKNEVEDRSHRAPTHFDFTEEKDGAAYGTEQTSIQKNMGTKTPAVATVSSFGGQAGGGYPPDPTGAAGPSQFVQAVNATPFKVYNKTTGATIMAAKNIGTLWSPATPNDGDPVCLYDKYADRWVLTQFGTSGNKIYIAVSTTNDPAGTYYTYTYTSASFPDYLKFSIWQDGYYMTSNQGGRLYVFERSQMLTGGTARSVTGTFTVGGTSGFWCPLAADADGGLPPAATPCPFFWYTDNSWSGSVDGVKYCKATVNWVPATPTLTVTPAVQITTAAFNGTYDPSWNDIPQPSAGNYLDGIGGVCTFRAQYRRWAGYNTVVLNWGVLITSSPRVRAIKWVELRETTPGVWTLYQEGIYQPDTKSRWVGSIAMDDNGSIGLAYARSGSGATDYPALCYTGRCAGDPLGTMTFAETTVKVGNSSQTGINRFGDYSQTTLDPTDGTLFYHTGEYISGGGPATWIYSFRLTPCTTGIDDAPNADNHVTAFTSNGDINVKGENLLESGDLVVDLFDMNGKQVQGKQVNVAGNSFETTLSTSDLAAGTYIVRVGKMNTSFQRTAKVTVVK
ncbi:MAG: T9SS type A sorting domain-containing protein [Bacteroidia bacterium]